MRDVACALGVHPSTISLALRGHASIPEATRERVVREAAALGYAPDPVLGALARYRRAMRPAPITAELAWVNRWVPSERLYARREFSLYWSGARQAALDLGYRLERFDIGEAPLSTLARMLRARSIAGVLIPPHHGACNDWSALDCSGLAVVRIGHSVALPAHAVGCDQVGAAMLGLQRIVERGYTRVGFVTTLASEMSTRFRAGFLFARDGVAGLERLPALTLLEDSTRATERALARWLEQNRPDVVFTSHAEVPGTLRKLGLRVPADLGLVVTSVLDGECDTGIDQRAAEIGRAGVELLDSLLSRGQLGLPEFPRMLTVSAAWCDGTSLPPRDAQLEEWRTPCAEAGVGPNLFKP